MGPTPVGLTLLALYALHAAVAIWTCAFNVENPPWGYLARLTVVLGLIEGAFEIYLAASSSERRRWVPGRFRRRVRKATMALTWPVLRGNLGGRVPYREARQ